MTNNLKEAQEFIRKKCDTDSFEEIIFDIYYELADGAKFSEQDPDIKLAIAKLLGFEGKEGGRE